jgi:hypothetical protein
VLPDAGAGKLAAPAQDDPVLDAHFLTIARLSARWEHRDAVAELCTPDVAQSEERSCAEPGSAAQLEREAALAQPDERE